MTAKEIADFSNNIIMEELKKYGKAVGKKTQQIIGQLEVNELSACASR